MAFLRLTTESDNTKFLELVKAFPEFRGRLLALFGARAREILKEQYLSGQEIDLRKFPTDRAGRFTITSNVNKARTATRIGAYPMNLFEKGRRLRSGEMEPGKFVITVKLKRMVEAGAALYIKYFENDILADIMAGHGVAL